MKLNISSSTLLMISMLVLILLITGCAAPGMKPLPDDLELDNENTGDDEDSVIDELTPIVVIGDDVSIAVYKCSSDTDCNRCQNNGVYGQTCIAGTCQGNLDLIENCEFECSAGECVDKDEFTADELAVGVGDDIDYEDIYDDDAIVDNDDLLPDPTQCTKDLSTCIGYRGIGSVYLTPFPECECKIIYVPEYCNPMEVPCPDHSPRTKYPDCACE